MRKIKPEIKDEPEVIEQPEVAETPVVEQPAVVEPAKPIEIVELEDVIQAESLTQEQQQAGVRFWFGEVAFLTFPDQSTYHIKGKNAFITDSILIHNLTEYAKANPTAKIFIQ